MRLQWRLLFHHRRPTFRPLPTTPFSLSLPPLHNPNPFHHSCFCSSSSNPSHPFPSCRPNAAGVLSWFFTPIGRPISKEEAQLRLKVSILRDKLVNMNGDSAKVYELLEQMGLPLFSEYFDGSALVELLGQLNDSPSLALEVFNWRRNHASLSFPMKPEEYTKGIMVVGRTRNVEIAEELFNEAVDHSLKSAAIYNSLMGVYMSNSLPDKCQSLFQELKMEEYCSPNIVTYNILISVFGRMLLVDHMEATLQEVYDTGLSPNLNTFNNLMAGYVTAWMWDQMEKTYSIMKYRNIRANTHTYKLMLKGYAYSGNLEKMEEMYELIKEHLDKEKFYTIRTMVYAYCKSSSENRVEKIEALIRQIPQQDYGPSLKVLLINLYAKEQLLEKMENLINVAFEQHIAVNSVSVMRAIITAYYHSRSIEKLTSFVKRAECAGWRLCRSLYHCKLVMYGSENRLEEMESVLTEMEEIDILPTKKTWSILCIAYSKWGPNCKLDQVKGLMCKYGYGIA